jgi:hypothetical protein
MRLAARLWLQARMDVAYVVFRSSLFILNKCEAGYSSRENDAQHSDKRAWKITVCSRDKKTAAGERCRFFLQKNFKQFAA